MWDLDTPLCPAGHLPLKGGDCAFMDVRHQSLTLQDESRGPYQPISPLEGEMSGRTEGGTVPPALIIKTRRDR
ncbi:hypothetical protein PPNSA23_43490 [Phyllobacterium phragmitis]|uniref:Lytic murein transglycosylase n=1 Tax=Phyllobacterium phragmitis TaxID=2670329 RepID=A0ABQ0H653_9HYPH